jgi:curved DNA-binding protein CbpA
MRSDPALENGELSEEFKAEVRDFARVLPNLGFYEVLGVPVSADLESIRVAFSERSRAYHPDRFFGRDLGPYGGLLNEIIKRVLAAYEVLKDVELREAYDRCLRRDPPAPPQPPAASPPLRRRPARKRPDAILRGLQRQLELTRSKARRHFHEAMRVMGEGDLKRAHALLRLALIFDPRERTYQDTFGEVALSLSRTPAASAPRSDVEENP